MTMGLVIMHWDERVGVEVIASYPDDIVIQEKTLMQLYSQHEFTSEAGMVSIMAGSTNLASYYTGPESAIYVILVLNADEDGDLFEDGLAETSRQILMNIESESLSSLLPSLFQRLSVYPTLNEEQRFSMIFGSEVQRMILLRLQNEAVIMKSEIAIWLKDEYKDGFIDVENVISSLVKTGLIKVASVKGLASDIIFSVEDLLVMRRPPVSLIKNPTDHHLPASLKSTYITEVRNFFQNYTPSEKDNLGIIENIILDPANYEVLKLLREAMVTRNDLEKLRKKGVDDVDAVLKAFWEAKMIAVFQDENANEYYCLMSDFYINKLYPRYNLDTILTQYRTKAQNSQALLKALDLMKEEYYIQANQKKLDLKMKKEAIIE